MDQESDLGEQRPEEIRHQIDETRSDLTDKLEAFEQKVKDAVSEARSAVVETVETVKHSVEDTIQAVKGTFHDSVDSVKHALDLGRQVDQHPWAMLAGSVAAGFVLSRLVSPRQPGSRAPDRSFAEALPPYPENGRRLRDLHHAGTDFTPPPPAGEPWLAKHGVFNELTEKFAPEIQKLKGLAIGTLMRLAQDMIKHSVAPPLASELERVLDRVTTKLGGVPLSGSVGDLSTEAVSVTSQKATREVSNSKMAGVPDCSGHEKHHSHC